MAQTNYEISVHPAHLILVNKIVCEQLAGKEDDSHERVVSIQDILETAANPNNEYDPEPSWADPCLFRSKEHWEANRHRFAEHTVYDPEARATFTLTSGDYKHLKKKVNLAGPNLAGVHSKAYLMIKEQIGEKATPKIVGDLPKGSGNGSDAGG